jgi:hypothetical protein
MATFNTSTGCFGTLCPPFATDAQLSDYSNAIQTSINSGNSTLKGITAIKLDQTPDLTSSGWTGATMVATGYNLPMVGVWQIGGSTKAVVYTDSSGVSTFSYKNDPGNMIQLISGGANIPGSTTGGSSTPPIAIVSNSTGTPWWVWLIVACVIMMFLGGAVFMISRRKVSSG